MYLCVNKSTGRIKTRGTLTDWNYQCHSFTAFKLCVIKAFNNVTFVISKTTKTKPQYIVVGLYHSGIRGNIQFFRRYCWWSDKRWWGSVSAISV